MNGTEPLLSLCVPNYNRGEYLDALLTSIVSQWSPELELVISDNGSDDGSDRVLSAYAEQYPWIRYQRFERNQGFQRNVIAVADMAQGRYCWMLGSDDELNHGSLERVLEAIRSGTALGGISVNYLINDMASGLTAPSFWTRAGQSDRLYHDPREAMAELGHYLGFFSAHIVQRRLMSQVISERRWADYEHFVHAFINGAALLRSRQWLFVAQECVRYRLGAQAILGYFGGDAIQRIQVEIQEYDAILSSLMANDTPLYRRTTERGVRLHLRNLVVQHLYGGMTLGARKRLFRLLFRFYGGYPSFWIRAAWCLALPAPLLRTLRDLWRSTKGLPVS